MADFVIAHLTFCILINFPVACYESLQCSTKSNSTSVVPSPDEKGGGLGMGLVKHIKLYQRTKCQWCKECLTP